MPFSIIALVIILALLFVAGVLAVVMWQLRGQLRRERAEVVRLKAEVRRAKQKQQEGTHFPENPTAVSPPPTNAPFAKKVQFILDRLMPGTVVKGETAVLGTPTTLPEETERELLSIVEEVTRKILRHTKPSKIKVTLDYREPNQLTLRLIDNGRGFDPANPSVGVGVTGMRERGMRINGRITINMRPEGGTELVCVIPIDANKDATGG